MLGGRVGGGTGIADHADHGRIVDDGAAAAGHDRGDLVLEAVEHAGQVERDDTVPEGLVDVTDCSLAVAAAGVVEGTVQASELLDGDIDQVGDLFLDGHVGGDEQGRAALCGDVGHRGLAPCLVAGADEHSRSLGDGSLGEGRTHSGGTSGDDDDLGLQTVGHGISFRCPAWK